MGLPAHFGGRAVPPNRHLDRLGESVRGQPRPSPRQPHEQSTPAQAASPKKYGQDSTPIPLYPH